MNIYDENKKALPDLDKFFDTKSSFLKDIWQRAKRWKLSDKQIEAAQKAWDRIVESRSVAIKLSRSDADTMLKIFEYMIHMKGVYGGAFWYKMREKVTQEKALSPKQYIAITNSAIKYKKALFKRIFNERREW